MALLFWLRALVRSGDLRRGQGLVEYAFIIIFVAVVLIALLVVLGPGIANIYRNIVDALTGI